MIAFMQQGKTVQPVPAWGLPVDLLSVIYGALTLPQKLACEPVCRTWLEFLRGQHSCSNRQLMTTVWNNALCYRIVRSRMQPDLLLHTKNELHAITLDAEMLPYRKSIEFFRWFKRMCPVFTKIQISLDDSDSGVNDLQAQQVEAGWVLPYLLETLHSSRQLQASDHLWTGANSIARAVVI